MEFKTFVTEESDSFDYTDKFNSLKFSIEFDEKEVVALINRYDRYVAYIDDGATYKRKNDQNAEIVATLLKMGCIEFVLKNMEDYNLKKYDWMIIGQKK